MKNRKLMAISLAAMTVITATVPAFAKDGFQEFTEDGTANVPVTCEIDSSYKVKLPAVISLAKNTASTDVKNDYVCGYQVGVAGNIDSDKFVSVVPDISDFVMKDASGKRQVKPDVFANRVTWSADDLDQANDEYVNTGSMVEAVIPKAGKYNGTIAYKFSLDETATENEFVNTSKSGTTVGDDGVIGQGVITPKITDTASGAAFTVETPAAGESAGATIVSTKNMTKDKKGNIILPETVMNGDEEVLVARITEAAVKDLSPAAEITVTGNTDEGKKTTLDGNFVKTGVADDGSYIYKRFFPSGDIAALVNVDESGKLGAEVIGAAVENDVIVVKKTIMADGVEIPVVKVRPDAFSGVSDLESENGQNLYTDMSWAEIEFEDESLVPQYD